MPQTAVSAPGKGLSVIDQFRRELDRMGPQFANALPAHIPVERFNRVVMTAIQNSPVLLKCTRQSLFNACMKAAADGLLPDGREGVIIPFGESEDGQKKSDQAGWLPMIAGIRKKARNSGELTDLYAHCVHQGDVFDIQLGDDPHVQHKPSLNGGRKRPIIGAYSIAVFKDGTKSHAWMNIDEIEDVHKRYSRSKRGPWSDPIAYPEMCVKTVVKKHAKSLPMSSDLDTVLRRDDELYEFKAARERGNEVTRRQPRNAMAALEQFASEGDGASSNLSIENGDSRDAPLSDGADFADPRPGDETVIEAVSERTAADAIGVLLGETAKHPPGNLDEFRLLVRGLVDLARTGEVDAVEKLRVWWTSAAARGLRNRAGLTSDDTAAIAAEIKLALEAPRD
jgi:recombination protein RecT